MAKKIVNLLILLPLGVILIVFCVANRQSVTLAFNPFRPDDQVLAVSAPFFVFLFIALITGMGSVFAVPVARATPEEFIAWRKSAGVSVVATHLAGAIDYRTIDYRKKPVVLLMGNEQSGLPEQLAKEADALARIPQQGRADSLNLAVATAIMLFEARRHLLSLAEGK